MVIKVSPDEALPTHHVRLSYEGIDIGLILCDSNGTANARGFQRSSYPRTALKTYSGDATYSDSEPPFTPISQSNWANGRGSDNFDRDASAYFDAKFANTTRQDEVILGGMEMITRVTPSVYSSWQLLEAGNPTQFTWSVVALTGANRYLSGQITATATTALTQMDLVIRRIGTPASLHYGIYADATGSPNMASNLGTGAIGTAGVDENLLDHIGDLFDASSALTVGVDYWIVVYGDAGDNAANHWEILCHDRGAASFAYLKASADGATWAQTKDHIIYAAGSGDIGSAGRFFSYKGQLYLINYDKLYVNGFQGVANGGSGTTVTVAGTPWTTNEWANCIVTFHEGTGAGYLAYPGGTRRVVSNTNNTLTLDKGIVAPDNTTVFNIVGSNKWTEITGHGLTIVYDVAVVNGQIYFAQGDTYDMRRARFYNNAGTWTAAYAAETGLKGGFLKVQPDGATSNLWWAAQATNDTWYTACVAEGSALGAATNVKVGSSSTKIMGLEVYGEDSSIWVLKEDTLYELKLLSGTYYPYKFKLDEIASMQDYRNGWAHIQHNVYLYFSMQDSLQRYYSSSLDNVGPDLGTGLPKDYRGHSTMLIGYPGRLINIIKGDRMSILMHNGSGWHSLFAASVDLWKTYHGFIQTIQGDNVDKLWFGWGPYAMWVPISLDPYNVKVTSYGSYPFRWESWFITSWFYIQMVDVEKFWYSLKLVTENIGTTRPICVDYQTDEDTAWTELGAYTTSFFEEKRFSEDNSITARRLRLRVRLQTLDSRYTPKLQATVIEAISRVQFKYQTSLTFRIADDDHDLNGARDPLTREQKSAKLQEWAAQAAPVKIYAVSAEFHDRYVLVEPASYRVLSRIANPDNDGEANICQVNLLEI